MNDNEKKELARDIVAELKKGHGCSVFDEDTIKGIKAIASMYSDGRKACRGAVMLLIGLGVIVLMVAGLKHWLKEF